MREGGFWTSQSAPQARAARKAAGQAAGTGQIADDGTTEKVS